MRERGIMQSVFYCRISDRSQSLLNEIKEKQEEIGAKR